MLNTYRSPEVTRDKLNEEQKKIYDRIALPRKGQVSGPYNMWVWDAGLCTSIYNLLEYFKNFSLESKSKEIITMTIARMTNTQHVWSSHEKKALESGISREILDALNKRQPVSFPERKDQVIYEITVLLVKGELVPEELYNEALQLLGLDILVEMSAYIGYYLMCGVTMNLFDVRCSEADNKLLP